MSDKLLLCLIVGLPAIWAVVILMILLLIVQ